MDPNRVFLVVCLTIVGVIAFNVLIYLSLRRGNEANAVDMFRQAAKRARDPWKDENEALEELSSLVASLKKEEMPRDDTIEDPLKGYDN